MPLYTINKFFGGISNDDYAGPAGAVFDAKNVDVGNSKGVILSRSRELFEPQLINSRANGQIVGMIVGTFPNRLGLSLDGRLYSGVNFGTETDITSIGGVGSNYRNMGVITTNTGTYGFILNNNKILRWSYDAGNSALGIGTGGANITSHLTLSTGYFDQKTQYLIRGNYLYISGGNKVYTIDTSSSTWIETSILTLDFGYTVKYMTNIGDQITIYAGDGSNGKQYFWDGITENFNSYIDWYDKPILGGATLNNIDYIVTGTSLKREFYVVNGYQPQLISQTDVYTYKYRDDKFFFAPDYANSIETIGKTIIIPGIGQIYKYGNSKIGLPTGFTRDFIKNITDSRNADITSLFYSDSFTASLLVFFTDFNSNYFLNNQLIATSNSVPYTVRFPGSVKTLKTDMGVYSQKKEAVKIRVGYDLPTNGNSTTSINIYAKINNKGNYADFYIADTYTTAPDIGDKYTFDSKTWTIYDITKKVYLNDVENKDGIILHCTYEGVYDERRNEIEFGTLTKSTGSGDNTFKFISADLGFKLIQKIEDTTTKRKTFMCAGYMDDTFFQEIQFKFDLITTNGKITPTLYEAYLQYNIIEEDLN